MKKASLILIAICATFVTAQAQDDFSYSGADVQYWEAEGDSDGRLLNKATFGDNWFLGFQAGTFYNWGSNQKHSSFWKHFRPSAAISLGKWFYPTVGLRLQGVWGNNRGITNLGNKFHWQTGAAYLDALFNLTNLICGYEESRPFNLVGFFGFGGEQTFGFSDRDWNANDCQFSTDKCTLLNMRVGLMALIRMSEKWDFSIEVSNNWLDDSYDGVITSNRWDGHVNTYLGFVRRLGNHDGTHQFTYMTRDLSKYKSLNDELNRLNNLIQAKQAAVANGRSDILTLVSFKPNSAKIDTLQEVNVYTAAQQMKKHNNEPELFITALGDKVFSAALFDQRANNIKDVLVKQYGIPAAKIHFEKDRDRAESDKRDHVVVYINE